MVLTFALNPNVCTHFKCVPLVILCSPQKKKNRSRDTRQVLFIISVEIYIGSRQQNRCRIAGFYMPFFLPCLVISLQNSTLNCSRMLWQIPGHQNFTNIFHIIYSKTVTVQIPAYFLYTLR